MQLILHRNQPYMHRNGQHYGMQMNYTFYAAKTQSVISYFCCNILIKYLRSYIRVHNRFAQFYP